MAYERPEVEAVSLMWGAVGTIGMRWKAFASQDALLATPEALISIDEASRILKVTCCMMGLPDNYGAALWDEMTRMHVMHEGESGKRGGWIPSDDVAFLMRPSLRSHAARAPWSRRRRGFSGRYDLCRRGDGVLREGLEEEREQEEEELREQDYDVGSASSCPEEERSTHSGGIKEERRDESDPDLPHRSSPRAGAGTSEVPLDSWPGLLQEGEEASDNREREHPPIPVEWPLVEGARVELKNLQSKNGATGTLLKLTACGKWKVRLDNGMGVALLKDHYIHALPPTHECETALL